MKHGKTHKSAKLNPFAKSLLMGFAATVVSWLVLTLVLALVLSSLTDHNSFGTVMSVVISAFSLAVGGFVLGKTNRDTAFAACFVLYAIVLAFSYGLSTVFHLSKNMSVVTKTVQMVFMLVMSLLGTKISVSEKKKRRHNTRRM